MRPLDVDLAEYQEEDSLEEFNVIVHGASPFFIKMLKGLIDFLCRRAGVQSIIHKPRPPIMPTPLSLPTPWVAPPYTPTPWVDTVDDWGNTGDDKTYKFKSWVAQNTAGEFSE